jgi:hypothetical protein
MRSGVLPSLIVMLTSAAAAAEAPAVAVFPFEFVDTSGEVQNPDRGARLKLATDALSEALAKTGRYAVVDLKAFNTEIEALPPRYRCGDCFLPVAREAKADYALISVVHKVSTLISTMNIVVFDASTGALVANVSGQIRGDTDEAYRHGVTFLVKDRLLDEIPGGGSGR